MIHKEFVKKF